jgi:ubiquinone/menaquinone biosynthesis C-methylase UbiE
MLAESRRKCGQASAAPGLVQANLAELDFFRDAFADVAVCLYSSIGMIRGKPHRQAFLEGVRRILKKGGLFFVHAHNRGNWLCDPHGIRNTLASYGRSWFDHEFEMGDRNYAYRGLPSMFLHIFSKSELLRALRRAGFEIESIRPLNQTSSELLSRPWWFPHLRAGGFLVTALSPPSNWQRTSDL